MIALENHLNALNFSTQLHELNTLLGEAETKVTFWGSRVIEVNGYTGSVYIDSIADKILQVGNECCDAQDLTLQERLDGVEISRKLKNFYRVTDTQVQNANWFTKLLVWLREFSFIPYTTRFYIEEDIAEQRFRSFTRENLLAQFGGHFNRNDEHPACDGAGGGFWAREDAIRAQLIPV